MNIFFLSRSPYDAAKYHCDKHVGKMLIESAQLLSTARIHYGFFAPYKLTHYNHPCAKWVRSAAGNYRWTLTLAYQLSYEYKHRFNKWHKTHFILDDLSVDVQHFKFPSHYFFDPPQAMPEEYYQDDPVKAYHDYYMFEKYHLLEYTNRDVPSWLCSA